ncbi:MAG: iron-containing alcohol dehydrogenase [Proteobacteria bacterium]|nr:iron-containing alcohol dehydrogenase [Pseudomonadota bacterium]
MAVVQFNYPTTIKFGAGAIKLASEVLKQRGLKRPMVVTDRALGNLPMITDVIASLGQVGLIPAVYAGVYGNPTESQVKGGVNAYHEHGADSLVIIGGGAPLDVGKAIALMVNHPGHLFDYEDGKPDARPVDQPVPFMIAVPTTSGTGSEVGRSSVVSDDTTHAKKIIFDPKLLPPLVLADPELTYGLPAAVTAAVGFDALTHNIEAFLAKGYHPLADGIALEGVRLVSLHLAKAVRAPRDYEARAGMQLASLMGAIAFQKGLGVTHSCAHALSTVYDTHHGLANALMLNACMEFNLSAVPERMARLGQAVGVRSLDQDTLGKGFISWLAALKKEVGLPTGLAAIGAKTNDALLDFAVADPCHGSNPRPVTRSDFINLFAQAQ